MKKADIDKKLDPQGQGFQLTARPESPLKRKFTIPPFSVLNTRDGEWQRRKAMWVRLGIESELGRGDSLNTGLAAAVSGKSAYDKSLTYSSAVNQLDKYDKQAGHNRKPRSITGTSVFDPVLCELAYHWWSPADGVVLDPFAGGSVRGIVASVMGRKYWGCDLSQKQVEANTAQLNQDTKGRWRPKWHYGDSYDLLPTAPWADFLFSCPPYGNLEQYSDDPRDVSSMRYPAFLKRYSSIIARAAQHLHPNRFACWVVANYRDKSHSSSVMRNLVGDTITAFEAAGLEFYNDAVLVNCIGTGAIRATRTFTAARKLIKLHQNVLVFVKGSAKKATANIDLHRDSP